MTCTRALVLTPGLAGADGIAHVARLVVGALRPAGVAAGPAIDVVCVDDPRDPERRARGAPGSLHLSGAGGSKLRFIALALRAAATSRPSDVLCLHLHLSPVARLVARRRARLLVFLHGIEAWRPLSALERWALRRADALVANSEHTAGRFLEANPALSDRRIQVCHLGVAAADDGRPDLPAEPCDARDPARASSDSPRVGVSADSGDPSRHGAPGDHGPGCGFALIVGRLAASERYKGHDLLIDLWPRIAVEVPGARLVVAGDGDDRARLEARARPLGDRVRFVGRVSDERLAGLYRDSAFFVMPSRGEGFGVVFLEAMRAGKACVGGAGAAAEVIEDGVTGLVADPADPESVLKAVVQLFREPGTRERMGAAGAARVAARFTEARFRCRFRSILGLDGP